ncbi:hypothetical protein [Aliiroseovarius sp. 2305UL8-7]|uniref:hypothetical protein n=1 Tax=Aliiroseovarius conchicola TaxID=3121637 RepID=UPI003527DE8E
MNAITRIPRIEDVDEIQYKGRTWRVVARGQVDLTLRTINEPALFESIRYEKLPALLEKPDFKLIPGARKLSQNIDRKFSTEELIIDLPNWQKTTVLEREFCVQLWLKAESAGKVKRVPRKARRFINKLERKLIKWLRKKNNGTKRIQRGQRHTLSKSPGFSTLMNWVRTYERSGRVAISLIDRRMNSGSKRWRKFTPETYAFIDEFILIYASPQRPTARSVARRCLDAIDEENEQLSATGGELFGRPCLRTIERKIANLPAFFVCCQREGVDAARLKFVNTGRGLQTLFPGERVEIDCWTGDIMLLLVDSGLAKHMTKEELARVPRAKMTVIVAIDHCTRVILGMRVISNPNGRDAVATLEMVTRDKSEITNALGTSRQWHHCVRPAMVVSDMGPEFANDAFEMAVLTLWSAYERNPAATPYLRSVNERLFGVFAQDLMAFLDGRTFANIFERGKLNPAERAVLTPDELTELLVWYVVDIYHQMPHSGIDYHSPALMWELMSSEVGYSTPPCGQHRRAAFGEHLERTLEGRGVLVNGIRYSSDLLRQLHHDRHDHKVELRYYTEDISWIMVKCNSEWVPAYSHISGLENVSAKVWCATIAELRKRGDEIYRQNLPTIRRAIRHFENKLKTVSATRWMTEKRTTAEFIDRQETQLFMGEEIIPWGDNDEDGDELRHLYEAGIPTGIAAESNEHMDDRPTAIPSTPRRIWTIEEDGE